VRRCHVPGDWSVARDGIISIKEGLCRYLKNEETDFDCGFREW